MTDHEYTYHRGTDGTVYRIHTEQDTDAESPRDSTDANLSTLVTWDSRWRSPDRSEDRQGRIISTPDDIDAEAIFERMPDHAARALHLYVKLYRPDILAAVPLQRDAGGGWAEGSIYTDPEGNRPIGVAYVTAEQWAKLMLDTPTDGSTGSPTPLQAIEQEVEVYNSWVQGEFAGYVVEQAHAWQDNDGDTIVTWDDYESCWGFESDTFAAEQATGSLPAGAVKLAVNEEVTGAYLED